MYDIFQQKSLKQIKMCGRVFQTLPLLRLLQIARSKKCTNQQLYSSSYNVCPTTHIPVIKPNRFYIEEHKQEEIKDEDLQNQDCRELTYMKWGHQSKFNMVINGRIEELLSKRMFVDIIQNRCVVILQGYFEWNQKKEPFSLRPKEGDHFLVAGLYTDDNQIIILTKDATPELAKVHHRMPVILSHEEVNIWMNPKNTKDIQNIIHKSLLKKEKEVWKNVGFARIAPHVNTLKEKSVKCLMTIDEYKKELDKTGLMKYWKKAPEVVAVEAPTIDPKISAGQQSTRTAGVKHDVEKRQERASMPQENEKIEQQEKNPEKKSEQALQKQIKEMEE